MSGARVIEVAAAVIKKRKGIGKHKGCMSNILAYGIHLEGFLKPLGLHYIKSCMKNSGYTFDFDFI